MDCVMKRLKRITMLRLRRPFALTQFLLIVTILYLIKRTRDRHRMTSLDLDKYQPISVAEPIDPDGGIGLFEDRALGRENELKVGKYDLASQEDNRHRDDIGDLIPSLHSALVDTAVASAGVADTAGAALPKADSSTFHFPVAGEELPLGSLAGDRGANIQDTGANIQDTGANIQDTGSNIQDTDANIQDTGSNIQDTDANIQDTGANIHDPGAHIQDDRGLEIIQRPAVMAQINPRRFSLEVTEEMLNTFSVTLPPLLPNFKNPCWEEEIPNGFTYDDSFFNTCHYIPHTNKLKHGAQFKAFERILMNRTSHGVTTRIRCFPYFFLIGVGKCGTTDVFDTLKKYFWELSPIFLKEPHYWEWKRCIDKLLCHGKHRTPTFAEYLDSFDPASDFVKEKRMIGQDGNPYYPLVVGDFTPSTLAFHPCWRLMPGNQGLDEPRYINAHYIKALRPETKFIAIMRDPVERVFSNFRMHDRMSAAESHGDAETFHDEMVAVLEYMNSCMRQKSARSCAYSVMKFDFGTHVTNSMYSVFVRDWLKLFPREQFLFLRMEDYMEDRVPHIREIVKFLEFEPMQPEKELMIGSKSVTNQAPPAAMLNETRKLLQDFYRPFNRELASILGDNKWNWGY